MAASAQVLPFPAQATSSRSDQVDDERDSKLYPVSKLQKQLQDYLGSKTSETSEAAEADKYFHGDQWEQHELQTLADRNQPPVTFNRIKRKINTIVGILEKARQDPKAFPNKPSPGAEDGAELATKVLRYALGWNWNDLSTQIARRTAVRGIGGVEMVLVPGDRGDPELELDEVDQRDFFYDPASAKSDFSDARYMGTTRWLDEDVIEDRWPDSVEDLEGVRSSAADAFWDRGDERFLHFYDRRRKRMRLTDHWYVRGPQWYYCIFVGDVVLEEGPSPFYDHKRRSIPKFLMMSAEVDHQLDRYGFYRDLKGAQDEINHRRSKSLHLLNNRRVIADEGAVDDIDLARREMSRSDGWVVKNPGKEIIPVENTADAQQNLELLQEAKAEIDSYGPNPALIGTEIDPSSGRAIQLLQAAGIAELGTYMSTFRNWKLRVYRSVWCACQQFWQAERWIRVADQEGMQQFIQVNGWQQDEFGFPVVINQLSALDVDIILEEGADTVNSAADTFDTLVALSQKGAAVQPQVLIELSALPSSMKKRILQLMSQGQQPSPMDMQALQLKLEEIRAQIQKDQSQAQLNMAKAAEIAAGEPEAGPSQQVDTPADLAKARLDLAKAQEIEQRVAQGQSDKMPTMWDVYEQQARTQASAAKARESEARATATLAQIPEAQARAAKTALEARTIAEAPAGMLQQPPPRPAGGTPRDR